MVLEIGRFQRERDALEAERDEAQKKLQQEEAKRQELDAQVGELQRQVAVLQASQAPTKAVFRTEDSAELVRIHHEKQLALMSTIDSLRSDLQSERERADAAEAERRAARADLLDATQRSVAVGGSEREASKQLAAARADLEKKSEAYRELEEEAIKLREALNEEKQKVLELKRAARSRASAWKEQLEEIKGDVEMKQQLERENEVLKQELAISKKELGIMRNEIERLRTELKESRKRGGEKVEELDILSTTMAGRITEVEQELNAQAQKSSHLFELFLRHLQEPLHVLRRCCRQSALQFASSLDDSLQELSLRDAPPVCEVNMHDLKGNLVKVVNLLRYAADVLEALEYYDPQGRPRSAKGIRGGVGGEVAGDKSTPPEDALGASGWFKGVFA
mmetsp:Transcript_72154/g.208980  ORF Transcript_72154/g.208980 Transcript_72154/m.208980 type:complete len:394 (-) Transcript_72154:42-1223(-)